MQDMIIKGTGNSRYLKSVPNIMTLYPTYEAFTQALAAGIFPIDLNGVNPDGVDTTGTALNKDNLLSDATVQTIGLSKENPTVSDAISYVGGANGVTTGTASALVLDGPNFQLVDGALIRFRLHVDSGTTPTINVNGTGAKALMATATTPMEGTKAGTWVTAVYSSALGFFVLQGSVTTGQGPGVTGLAHGKTFESISGTGMARINIAKMKGWV